MGAVGVPFAVARIGRVDGAHFRQRSTIEDVDLARKISEPSESQKPSLWVERNKVTRMRAEVVDELDALIEQYRLGGHISIDYTKLF